MFLTFYGEPRGDHHTHEHAHESPMTMVAPLGVLAVGAIFAGMVWYKPFFRLSEASVDKFFGNIRQGRGTCAVMLDRRDPEDNHEETCLALHMEPGEGGFTARCTTCASDTGPKWVKVARFTSAMTGLHVALRRIAHLVPKWVKLGRPFHRDADRASCGLPDGLFRRPDWPNAHDWPRTSPILYNGSC